MDRQNICKIGGLSVFCFLFTMFIFWHNITIGVLADFSAFVFTLFFGISLAFAKNPKNINDFLGYFSKTIVLSGGIIFSLLFIKVIFDLSDPEAIGPTIAFLFIIMLYVLLLSSVSYVLHTKESK